MRLNRTILTYSLLTIFAFAFNKIYSIFGHGVTSFWMSNMYLYLFGLGVFVFALLRIFIPDVVYCKSYRLFYNTYNTGVAVLLNGMLQKGILEIAGGSSHIVPWFLYTGWGLIAIAAVMLFMVVRRMSRKGTVLF